MIETLNYWNQKAKNSLDNESVTHSDIHQRQFEISTLIKYLDKTDKVLDIGCGNGFSTIFFSDYCQEIMGGDFSPEMVKRARIENSKNGLIKFEIIDARNFNLEIKFSKIITQRCLINILDWELQKKAITNIANHLTDAGTFLMMEGIKDGRANLNLLRNTLGLENLSKVEYNLDFEEKETNKFLSQYFNIEDFVTFGTYEFITRVIYPLYIHPNIPQYGSKFHEIAQNFTEKVTDFAPHISKLGLWVLRKK
jgi:SAM-dependent methyltransferase